MTDAATLSELGVWTDVAANGGTRESVFVAPLQLTDDIEIREDGHLGTEKLTAVVDASEPAYDDVTPGKVLRVELADGEATEWRVFKVTTDRNTDGGLEATIVCESIAWDLIRRVPLVDRVEAGRADLDFSLLSLTPTEWIDDVLLTTSGFPSWITRGTVDPTDDLSLPVDGEPAGKLLNKIAELTASEWTLRRNGATDYKIDVLSERGATSRRPLIALRRNMLSMSKETTAENQATRVYPRGGGQRGFRGTMADAKWKVTGVA